MGTDYEQLLRDNEAAKQGELQKVNDAYNKTASDYQAVVNSQQQQLKDNETAKKSELQKTNASYSKTASDYQAEVNKQQQQLEAYKAEQSRLQQEQTDFAIDKIEQQQEQTEKDYTKEQQGAYGDYKRQTDPYGANAEQMASMGLSRSGYSESSNVAMYTAYQNRVAAARASFEQAKLTFDNAIREAKLTNDINLAKIAQETLEKSLALSMESVIYLGNLELEKAAKLSAIEQTYYDREQDIRDAQQESVAYLGNLELEKAAKLSAIEQTYYNRAQDIRDAQQAAIAAAKKAEIEAAKKAEKEAAKKAEAEAAKQEEILITGDDTTTGDEKIDESIKTALSIAFPNRVITDENTWNDLVKEYGEKTVRSWGYKPVNKHVGIQFTHQALHPNSREFNEMFSKSLR